MLHSVQKYKAPCIHARRPNGNMRARAGDRSLLTLAPAERIRTNFIAERLHQHAKKPQLAPIAKLFDADGHVFMPSRRPVSIGAEQTIPPWRVETEIAVGLVRQYRMVHAMHVGRDHKPAQH